MRCILGRSRITLEAVNNSGVGEGWFKKISNGLNLSGKRVTAKSGFPLKGGQRNGKTPSSGSQVSSVI